MIARILFGRPGDFFDRHQYTLLIAVFLLIGTSEWLATMAGLL